MGLSLVCDFHIFWRKWECAWLLVSNSDCYKSIMVSVVTRELLYQEAFLEDLRAFERVDGYIRAYIHTSRSFNTRFNLCLLDLVGGHLAAAAAAAATMFH